MGNTPSVSQSEQLTIVSFICRECGHKFKTSPDRVEADHGRDYHPFIYFSDCPECQYEAEQAPWERNLLKAWPNATGPRTEAGKEASAANLAGHPTPEESLNTRFNALKHGLFADVATYFPARPGKYDQCTGCEHAEDESCLQYQACLRRTELFFKHHLAFDSQDPKLLMRLRSNTHAALQGLVDDMILAITARGVELENPVYGFDKDGGFNIGKYTDPVSGEQKVITEVHAHPLMKILGEWVSKINIGLDDMAMTPKAQDQQNAIEGYLQQEGQRQENSLEFQKQTQGQLEKLRGLILNSNQALKKDPILAEYRELNDDG